MLPECSLLHMIAQWSSQTSSFSIEAYLALLWGEGDSEGSRHSWYNLATSILWTDHMEILRVLQLQLHMAWNLTKK